MTEKPAENNDIKVQLPSWVKYSTASAGFAGLVAMILLASVLGWFPSPREKELMETLKRMEYSMWYQSAILRNICYYVSYESASKDREPNRCEPWREKRE